MWQSPEKKGIFMREKACKKCGKCCDQFPMSLGQMRKIEDYLLSHPDIIIKMRSLPEIKSETRRVCPFLRENSGETYCLIYPVRPEICKAISIKGLSEDFACPEGTVSTEYSVQEITKMLEVYTKPNDDFIRNPADYFRDRFLVKL